jgi:hypothetical protein
MYKYLINIQVNESDDTQKINAQKSINSIKKRKGEGERERERDF